MAYGVENGRTHPLGATLDAQGVNFSVWSEHATGVELLLFEHHSDPEPFQVVKLNHKFNKTFQFWHCYVRGLRAGAFYAYRVDGPTDVAHGHRFNPSKVILDPYARATDSYLWKRGDACGADDNLRTSQRCVVVDQSYDWEGDQPLNRRMSETIVYEMHVGGFTKSPTSGVAHPGTYEGVIEKIPYLKELGVTAVELLPVFDFDPSEIDKPNPAGGPNLSNYWGYSTVSFFAPHSRYCVSSSSGSHMREFRDMVKALHKADIEVILDVVFNHTSEGNHDGPTINFKGFGNSTYYYLWPPDHQFYMDYSGCGNTLNCNHPIPEKLIIECLEYWHSEMHVDGFRFDEGSILSRGPDGAPMDYPPVLWHIELSEELADCKIIAEAWDAAGLFQIGYFPGFRWAEWNGLYRDTVRRFVRGDRGLVGLMASRIAGSADIYERTGRLAVNSINFITCHDGFTLNDVVSYNHKHNEANGEGNRDGQDENFSWNSGFEGKTDDPGVEALRRRQIKNFATILLLSQGVPMITYGDEVRRTQHGNNNAYCQDSELSWFDWSLVDKNKELLRFFQRMIALRRESGQLHRVRFERGEVNDRGLHDIEWHGCKLRSPGFGDPASGVLALTIGNMVGPGPDLHVVLNMEDQELDFEVPPMTGRSWYRLVDTSLASPADFCDPGVEVAVAGNSIKAAARSVVVLISK
ncbi:MAG TPA: glycogen debranching protein GlgX [Candidatus Dormibacteraeota bacterium]